MTRVLKCFVLATLVVAWAGAQSNAGLDSDFLSHGASSFPRFWKAYQSAPIPPPNLKNGPRLQQMIAQGKLELTLNDLLKLVVENGLDVEANRYNYLIAQTDILRAKSGQAARGLQLAPVPGGLFTGAIGAGVGNNANVSPGGTGGAAISAAARQFVLGPRGNFDPTFSANFSFDRVISPLNTTRVSGTPTVTVPSTVLQTRYQQELPYGTSYSISFNLQRQSSTQRFLLFNPAFQSFFSAQVYQPLLNGFGLALTRRFITFTENNRKISREIFRQQLNDRLSIAANLYWDFVALREQLRVAEQSLAVAQKLYEDNQKQAQVGALAPLDLVQSQSQVATSRRDLVVAQSNLRMQETRIKATISKALGTDLDQVRVEPVDALPGAGAIEVPPLDRALAAALANRAVVHQGELQLENQRASQAFTHKNLLPTLSTFVQFNSYSLAEGTNAMFRQMVQWVYPEFSAGMTLTFSIFNRAAQADEIRSRLDLRQAQVTLQQTKNTVGLGVRTAAANLMQSRAQIEAAERARASSQESFRGQQIRLQNGLATPYSVILSQRDLAAAQFAEIQAKVNAAKALVALQVAMGTFLQSHEISFDDALRGDLFTGSTQ